MQQQISAAEAGAARMHAAAAIMYVQHMTAASSAAIKLNTNKA
jgi:hypothetical protein